MSSTLRICLKSGDRIFVNGAVLRADRKVTLEILNDVTFLLEHHVIGEEDATTPLRRLYFHVQTILTEPASAARERDAARAIVDRLSSATDDDVAIAERLATIAEMIERERPFEALKSIRALFPIEDRIGAARRSG